LSAKFIFSKKTLLKKGLTAETPSMQKKGKVYFLQKHGFFSAELVKISAFFAARR
jgi:hypothetical protein